jgi:hypothetical protein
MYNGVLQAAHLPRMLGQPMPFSPRAVEPGNDPAAVTDWLYRVCRAVREIEVVVQQRRDYLRSADGFLSVIDQSCATIMRQHRRLCRLYRDLLERTLSLKWKAHHACAKPVATSGSPPADLCELARSLWSLLGELKECESMETALLLDSVLWETGVGD